MGFDVSGLLADKGWTGGTSSVPVTNLSPQVDGGESSVNLVMTGSVSDEQRFVLYGSATVVAVSIVLLWLLGGFALKGLPGI